jgi:hypothetical protein
MKQPKDYGDRSGLLKEMDYDDDTLLRVIWISMTVLGAFFIPYTTLVIVLILKLVEMKE